MAETPAGADGAGPLADLRRLADDPAGAGVLWKLGDPGRQLDANVVRLAARQHIPEHTEPDLDVMVLWVAGKGTVTIEGSPHRLGEGGLLWVPRGTPRSLTAGADGLTCLTVHRRRPEMGIRRRSDPPTDQ